MFLGAVVIVVVGVLVINYFRGIDTQETMPPLETEEMAQTGDLPTTHNVAAGEDLWSISEEYYGTGYNWVDIAEANDLSSPGSITEGEELIIPNVQSRELGESLADTQASSEEAMLEETNELVTPTETPTPTVVSPTKTEEEMTESTLDGEGQATTSIEEDTSTNQVEQSIEGDSYTVVKGDTLWDIAQRAYGDPYKWVEIAKTNKLVNPDLIHPGNSFVIPR